MSQNHNIVLFTKFAAVGVAGYFVDASVLHLAMLGGMGFYGGRVVSFLVAATFTWMVNRLLTFRHAARSDKKSAQWLKFVVANSLGGLVNLGVYSALVAATSWFATYPSLAVGVGSLSGLGFNFAASKRLVFRVP
ncbi:MAG: GtrA family protein [Alphaproteobacteria bacterium]|nr:GtrA family protein [Alphaproteobacteria bacterium]